MFVEKSCQMFLCLIAVLLAALRAILPGGSLIKRYQFSFLNSLKKLTVKIIDTTFELEVQGGRDRLGHLGVTPTVDEVRYNFVSRFTISIQSGASISAHC